MERATSDFLAEVKASEQKAAALAAEIVQETGMIDERARGWSRALMTIEASETDPLVLGKMEMAQQTCRALQRELGEMEDALRKVVRTEKQFYRIMAELKGASDGNAGNV